MPHVWSDWTQAVLAEADEVVITAVPDLANLRNTKNLLDALKKLRPNDKVPHLLLNQVGMAKRPEIEPSDFFGPLEIEPLAIIPFDVQLFGSASNSGRMISEIDAKSPIAETFSQLSHVLTGRSSARKAKRPGLGKFIEILKRK
ncbi:Flp pilus assembly CpaE family ATPase [Agrobacterium larrymoorei]|uniref:Flp pilus assembly CpaE family ATPase n=1 Tax=Agrobacterium larrymoorei TaxID=160699 RepID=A0AAJ2BQM1_9HYPH|nr:Flp pilus assembly CpaE family ATPase [Agrobacterium larrymoorei]